MRHQSTATLRELITGRALVLQRESEVREGLAERSGNPFGSFMECLPNCGYPSTLRELDKLHRLLWGSKPPRMVGDRQQIGF